MAEKFSDLMKSNKLHIQKPQQTAISNNFKEILYLDTQTPECQTVKKKNTRQNRKTKRGVIHHI